MNEGLSTYWCDRIWQAQDAGYIDWDKAEAFCNAISSDSEMVRLLESNSPWRKEWCAKAQKSGYDIYEIDVINLWHGINDTYSG